MSKLFSVAKIGALTLQSAVVMAPMTRNRATSNHLLIDEMAKYYGQRAAGTGLIITEGTSPNANG
jgi:N-ethylmaleimide reductase